MSEIKDSFTYSVAEKSFRGYLATGLYMEDSYFEERLSPDEFVLLLSCGSCYYPISLKRFHEADVQDIDASDVFPVTGEFSNLFDSAAYSGSRKQCDICSMQTQRVHKVSYDSHNNIYSAIKNSDEVVEEMYEEMSPYEMDSFYHCHYCMQDIHEEVQQYIEESGQAVLLSNTI